MDRPDKLWELMEKCYRKHGASINGAQLTMRDWSLEYMRKHYSDEEIEDMLLHDFDKYHELSGVIFEH